MALDLFHSILVFFNGGDAEISVANYSDCTLTESLCDTRKCVTQFIKNVQKDPKGDCG